MSVPRLNIPQPSSHGDWQSFANALTVSLQQYDTEMQIFLDGLTDLKDFADDVAAAVGGVPVRGLYRTGSIVKVRVS